MNQPKMRESARKAVLALMIAAIGHWPAMGEEPTDPPPTDEEKSWLRAAERHMQTLELRRVDADEAVIKLVDHPLLSFGDAARMHQRGSFWAT